MSVNRLLQETGTVEAGFTFTRGAALWAGTSPPEVVQGERGATAAPGEGKVGSLPRPSSSIGGALLVR